MGFGFDFGFGMFGVMFMLMFILVFGFFIVTIVRGIGQWNKNNNSPRLTVAANVVSKRTNVSHHHHDHHTPFHQLLCHLPGGQWRPDGVTYDRTGIRDARGGRQRISDVPGHTVSGI